MYSSINSEGLLDDGGNSGRSSALDEIEVGLKQGGGSGGFAEPLSGGGSVDGGSNAGTSNERPTSQRVHSVPPLPSSQPPSPRVVASAMIPVAGPVVVASGTARSAMSVVSEWPKDDELFYIFPRYDPNRALTCQNGGTKVILQELLPSGEPGSATPANAHQQWRLMQRGTNATTFYFTPVHAPHLGLDCQNPDRGCYLWDLNDRSGRENPAVLWNVVSVPEGGHFIISKPTTQTNLDAFESCRGSGEVTRVGTCSERHAGANQQWRFVPTHIWDAELRIMGGSSAAASPSGPHPRHGETTPCSSLKSSHTSGDLVRTPK